MNKFNEEQILDELRKYVNLTYSQHYAKSKYQATEFILDAGHGEGFCIGNIMKYAQRYGKKGSVSGWRRDLFKIIHYAMILIADHDNRHSCDSSTAEFIVESDQKGDQTS